MSRYALAVRLLPIAAVALGAACSAATAPQDSAARATPAVQAVQAPDVATLARAIPGFGGLFLDRGVPTVYLTDATQRGAVERVLGGFARARGFAPSQIHVLPGRFAYGDLDRWEAQVTNEVFAGGGVVFVDLDEAANRVLVAVEPGASQARVRGLAARLGVPAQALVVREIGRAHV